MPLLREKKPWKELMKRLKMILVVTHAKEGIKSFLWTATCRLWMDMKLQE
jgi:hypothetical protein